MAKQRKLTYLELLNCSIEVLHEQITQNHDSKYHGVLEKACLERIRRIPPATNSYTSYSPIDFAASPYAVVGRRSDGGYVNTLEADGWCNVY